MFGIEYYMIPLANTNANGEPEAWSEVAIYDSVQNTILITNSLSIIILKRHIKQSVFDQILTLCSHFHILLPYIYAIIRQQLFAQTYCSEGIKMHNFRRRSFDVSIRL